MLTKRGISAPAQREPPRKPAGALDDASQRHVVGRRVSVPYLAKAEDFSLSRIEVAGSGIRIRKLRSL